jgi:hypothetical protein
MYRGRVHNQVAKARVYVARRIPVRRACQIFHHRTFSQKKCTFIFASALISHIHWEIKIAVRAQRGEFERAKGQQVNWRPLVFGHLG